LRQRRTIGFILAILLGVIGGLLYGWFVRPPEVKNTTLSSLRSDYQADYVLMVARAYPDPADLTSAVEKLKELDPSNPLRAVQQALLTAQQLGYSDSDLRALAALEMRLTDIPGGTP
jgi:hypothetical protein